MGWKKLTSLACWPSLSLSCTVLRERERMEKMTEWVQRTDSHSEFGTCQSFLPQMSRYLLILQLFIVSRWWKCLTYFQCMQWLLCVLYLKFIGPSPKISWTYLESLSLQIRDYTVITVSKLHMCININLDVKYLSVCVCFETLFSCLFFFFKRGVSPNCDLTSHWEQTKVNRQSK